MTSRKEAELIEILVFLKRLKVKSAKKLVKPEQSERKLSIVKATIFWRREEALKEKKMPE